MMESFEELIKKSQESIKQSQAKIKNFRKKLQEDVEIRTDLQQVQLLQIQKNPSSIGNMSNPSLIVQFLALNGMRNSMLGIRKSCFPKNTLLYEIEQNNVENVVKIIESEKEFFQKQMFFEELIDHLFTTKKDWIPPVLGALNPLTEEQEQFWKIKRLLQLF